MGGAGRCVRQGGRGWRAGMHLGTGLCAVTIPSPLESDHLHVGCGLHKRLLLLHHLQDTYLQPVSPGPQASH